VKKAKEPSRGRSRRRESVPRDRPACPTCGQALGRDAPDGVVLVPNLTEADEGSDPPGSVPRALALKRERSDANAADLAAFEAMWPPRNPGEPPERP
jgi:hypothetical protein